MSAFTIFRNDIEDQLGIRTPDQAAETAGNLTAQAIEMGKRGSSGDTTIKPSPAAPNFHNSVSTGNFSKPVLFGLSSGALIAIAAVFLLLKRR